MTQLHRNAGSSFDDFLRDEGISEEVTSIAAARVLAWQQREQVRFESETTLHTEPD